MEDSTKAGIITALIFLVGLTASTIYKDKIERDCKVTAINKGLPTLEIQELCK